jgi:hypothetical protein
MIKKSVAHRADPLNDADPNPENKQAIRDVKPLKMQRLRALGACMLTMFVRGQ